MGSRSRRNRTRTVSVGGRALVLGEIGLKEVMDHREKTGPGVGPVVYYRGGEPEEDRHCQRV